MAEYYVERVRACMLLESLMNCQERLTGLNERDRYWIRKSAAGPPPSALSSSAEQPEKKVDKRACGVVWPAVRDGRPTLLSTAYSNAPSSPPLRGQARGSTAKSSPTRPGYRPRGEIRLKSVGSHKGTKTGNTRSVGRSACWRPRN